MQPNNNEKTIPFDEVVKLAQLMNLRSSFYYGSGSYDEADEWVRAKQKELGLEGLVHEMERE